MITHKGEFTMRVNRILLVIALIAVGATGGAFFNHLITPGASSSVFAQAEAGPKLAEVMERGVLNCGIDGGLPGFSNANPDTGVIEGLDADYCRAVAAAIWGEATAENINFVPLTANERFTALQSGQIDVLIRNTTWTFTRDAELGSNFGPTIFYDGQGLMVKTDLGVTTIDELDGATICSTTGTTTEKNIADAMNSRGFEWTLVGVEDTAASIAAFEEGACDVLTSDKSQLAGLRSASSDPSSMVILSDTLSKEPLGPMYLSGDPQWGDIIDWTVYATFQAEEFGVTSANLDEMMGSDNLEIARFLGQDDSALGSKLGLSDQFAANIIRAIGNYAEAYERNVTPIGVPREGSLNALWSQGGLHYSPAWR
jgi:general L-amino acid transport system substrate-binding protein